MKTTPGVSGWRKTRQPLSEVVGRMAGRNAPVRLGLSADYVPPKPQGSLFDDVDADGDQDGEEALQTFG